MQNNHKLTLPQLKEKCSKLESALERGIGNTAEIERHLRLAKMAIKRINHLYNN